MGTILNLSYSISSNLAAARPTFLWLVKSVISNEKYNLTNAEDGMPEQQQPFGRLSWAPNTHNGIFWNHTPVSSSEVNQ